MKPLSFIWPDLLWLLALLPLLVALYVVMLRRKKKLALRYASLTIVKEALGRGSRWRRHVPPFLFLCALALMLVAVARPVAVVTLPSQEQTVILAMDVSGSMRARDVEPNRLAASQNAARAFIAELPRHTKVGVVSFAGSAAPPPAAACWSRCRRCSRITASMSPPPSTAATPGAPGRSSWGRRRRGPSSSRCRPAPTTTWSSSC